MAHRKRLNLKEKIKIIEDNDSGLLLGQLAIKYSLSKSTIHGIIKNKNKVLRNFKLTHSGTGARKTLRRGEFHRMENLLYKWFVKQREKNIPISGEIIKAKARYFLTKIDPHSDFFASQGWLNKFKKRFGIRLLKQCGEKLSSQAELVEPFKQKLKQVIVDMDISLDALFNADETGLYWKLLPEKTYAHAGEATAPGRKLSKERLTFLACSNATGTLKLKPLIIGKSKKPRSFKNEKLPIDYDYSKSAWMNAIIFKNWYFKNFVVQVEEFLKDKRLPVKALLLLDNAPSHPPEEELIKETVDGQIRVMYMPPNVTPLIQPMDQNAIRLTKLFYRTSLLAHIVASETQNISDALKSFKLNEAVILLAQSWNRLTTDTLRKCWNKILQFNEEEFDEYDDIPLSILRRDNEVSSLNRTIHLINEIFPQNQCTVEDIHEWNRADPIDDDPAENIEPGEVVEVESSENENEYEKIESDNVAIKHETAIQSFKVCMEWAAQNDVEFEDIFFLKKLQEKAIDLQIAKKTK